jgi:hypothetical protein
MFQTSLIGSLSVGLMSRHVIGLNNDERSVRANFLGLARNTKGFLVRDIATRRIYVSRTITFNERFSKRSPGTFAEIDQAGRTIQLRPANVPEPTIQVPTIKPLCWDRTMPEGLMRTWTPSEETWILGSRAFEWSTRQQRAGANRSEPGESSSPETSAEPRRTSRAGAGTRRLNPESSLYEEWEVAHRRSAAVRKTETLRTPVERISEPDPARTLMNRMLRLLDWILLV